MNVYDEVYIRFAVSIQYYTCFVMDSKPPSDFLLRCLRNISYVELFHVRDLCGLLRSAVSYVDVIK